MFDLLLEEIQNLAGSVIGHSTWLSREASKLVINSIVGVTRNRPHPWSTVADYTSWHGLTDRTYLARHLPPREPPTDLPDINKVIELFARPPGGQLLSEKSTCLFPAFAQYLTDGFIRTDHQDRAKTTSNHEIDLCPLYGRTLAQTQLLREHNPAQGHKGRLKSQVIKGEEYAPFLYLDQGARRNPEFNVPGFDWPLSPFPVDPPPAQAATLIAFGGDRANSTPFSAMMNTLLLREHNRVAGALEHENSGWDDERVFQTARNIMIPMFIKIVVEQYINHIAPLPFNLKADPSVAWHADWNRPNWMTVEFSLLYRWHSLMPDRIEWAAGRHIPLAQFGLDNEPLITAGLDAAFSAASAQKAAELGALNTAEALRQVEWLGVQQARTNRLDTYNEYRKAFKLKPAVSFADISSVPTVQALLKELYKTTDNVEFYAGLFAEDRVKNSPLPELILRMVGVDAFSQALTNPLLSEHVFNEQTFTPWGFELINSTSTLEDMLARNVARRGPQPIRMTQASWRYS